MTYGATYGPGSSLPAQGAFSGAGKKKKREKQLEDLGTDSPACCSGERGLGDAPPWEMQVGSGYAICNNCYILQTLGMQNMTIFDA